MRRLAVVFSLAIVAALVVATYALKIEEVAVTGVHTLSPRKVVEASGLEPGERILWERLSAAERSVERLPAVSEAVAERVLPSTVVIHVTERVPVARLDGARQLVADREGVIFEAGDVVTEPVLYGWKGKRREGSRVDERSRTVLGAFADFPGLLRERGRKLFVGRAFSVTLLGGTQVRFGGLFDLDVKADAAEAVLRAERGTKLAYIDVRSPSVPVSRERTPAPSPSASPLDGPPAAASPSAASTPAPTAAPPASSAMPATPRPPAAAAAR